MGRHSLSSNLSSSSTTEGSNDLASHKLRALSYLQAYRMFMILGVWGLWFHYSKMAIKNRECPPQDHSKNGLYAGQSDHLLEQGKSRLLEKQEITIPTKWNVFCAIPIGLKLIDPLFECHASWSKSQEVKAFPRLKMALELMLSTEDRLMPKHSSIPGNHKEPPPQELAGVLQVFLGAGAGAGAEACSLV
ncbi:hypothetical protein Tco_0449611 [Tanacetum coccineum]